MLLTLLAALLIHHRVHGAQDTLVTSLPTATWHNLFIDEVNSPSGAKLYWQRTSQFRGYTAAKPSLDLLPNPAPQEKPDAAYWSQLDAIPPFGATCTKRTVKILVDYELLSSSDTPRTQSFAGMIMRFGLGSDAATELNLAGLAYGFGGGILPQYVMYNTDFAHPTGYVGAIDMTQLCLSGAASTRCVVLPQTALAPQRGGRYNGTMLAVINANGTMQTQSYDLYNAQLAQRTLALKPTDFPFENPSVQAARWLNKNGTLTPPIIFLETRATNVSVYRLDILLTDTCAGGTSSTTVKVTSVPAPTVVPSAPTTTTTTIASSSVTPDSDTSQSESSVSAAQQQTSADSLQSSTASVSTDLSSETAYSRMPVDEGETDYVPIIIGVTLAFVCLAGVFTAHAFRRQIQHSQFYGRVYFATPCRQCVWFCCKPMREIDSMPGSTRDLTLIEAHGARTRGKAALDAEAAFGNVPEYLRRTLESDDDDSDALKPRRPAPKNPQSVVNYSVLPAFPNGGPGEITADSEYVAIPIHGSEPQMPHTVRRGGGGGGGTQRKTKKPSEYQPAQHGTAGREYDSVAAVSRQAYDQVAQRNGAAGEPTVVSDVDSESDGGTASAMKTKKQEKKQQQKTKHYDQATSPMKL